MVRELKTPISLKEVVCPYSCGNPVVGFAKVVEHLHMCHGFSFKKAENFIRNGRLPQETKIRRMSDTEKLKILKEQTGGATYQCASCDFKTGATTYGGIKAALQHHRREFPGHHRLKRIVLDDGKS